MGINETGVSRRSFITGAAAAGVLATLGLAGCAPQDKQTASAATSGADTKWDEECDVLVVGSGYTGLAAALEAKNAGADVKVIEKTARVGGNSALAAGDFAVCNSSVQKREGVQDSVEQYVDDMMVAGLHLNDKEKCRVIAEKSNETWSGPSRWAPPGRRTTTTSTSSTRTEATPLCVPSRRATAAART